MISQQVLGVLWPNGILIHAAHGSVVDQDAWVPSLRSRKIAGAGWDVCADEPDVPTEWMGLDSVVFTPHIARS